MKKLLPEAFYHFLWKYRLLDPRLRTEQGEPVIILHTGLHNTDAGPDFLMARVRIGSTLWVGNIEIHTRASDWYRHRHNLDEAYNNVVLHVVAIADSDCTTRSGRLLPALCIEGSYQESYAGRYLALAGNLNWVPCENMLDQVGSIHKLSCIQSCAGERLERKAGEVKLILQSCGNDWDECCYRLIAKQFGAKVNVSNFEMLTAALPSRILMKYHGDVFSLEALLFGQSGLLGQRLTEAYPRKLKNEYCYLAAKHKLTPMPGYLWNFLRLRPANFPTLRIAQLASLYGSHQRIFMSIIESSGITSLQELFRVCGSDYWDRHFMFNKKSGLSKKCMGREGIHSMLVNAVIPMLFHYGEAMGKPAYCKRALAFLEELVPERNAIITRWKHTGLIPANSLETQGLLELKSAYCDQRRCLDCRIGLQILKK